MSDSYVRKLGEVKGIDGETLTVGVDYDTVAVYAGSWMSADGCRLNFEQAVGFIGLFANATHQASQQARAMAEDAADPEPDWRFEWEMVARDGAGNAVLEHKSTGGRYRIIPEEDL